MSLLSFVPRINITKVVSVTPTVSANSAYTSGNQLGGIMTLTDVIRQDGNLGNSSTGGSCELVSVTILDKSSQNAAIDIWLFSVSPTIASSDNAAWNITDANLVAAGIGVVSVGSSYSGSSSNSISSSVNLNLPLVSSSGTSLYAVAVVRGTPTYTSTSDLVFKFGFFVD